MSARNVGVTISMAVEVDPATAFDVFTEDISLWWKPLPQQRFHRKHTGRMRFEPGEGGRLLEEYDAPGVQPWIVGRVKVWQPGERLVFEWRAPNYAEDEATEVEVAFERIDEGTCVTLEHRGWDALRSDHPAKHGLPDDALWRMISSFWSDLLRAARRHAEKKRTSSAS